MKTFAAEFMLAVSRSFPAMILLKVTLTTALTLVATHFGKRSRAAVRHVLLASGFAVLLALPIISVVATPIPISLAIVTDQSLIPRPSETVSVTIPYKVSSTESSTAPGRSKSEMVSGAALPSWPVLLLAAWIVGGGVFLLPVIGGLWQTRSLRRSGLPWPPGDAVANELAGEMGIQRPVQVLLHESAPGPMTCGVTRPQVLLPLDATNWTGDELSRALIHELEHVRRSDWMTRCLARTLCALYWFHPLVWAAWRQFVLEAERACDDAVLQRGEATAYADQLVGLAQRLLKHPQQPMLAMANRHDLAQRVSALLERGRRRGPAGGLSVILALTVSVVLISTLSPLQIVARQTSPIQTATAADNQRFEIASIKSCREEDFAVSGQRRQEVTVSPGRITVNCIAAARIIFFAYAGVGNMSHPLLNASPSNADNIRGGPGWLRSDRFVIEAKAEGTPDREVMMGPMLRALLEERFHLKTRRETEEVPMYALVVAKTGIKIQPLGPDGCTSTQIAINLSRDEFFSLNKTKPVCGNFTSLGDGVNGNWTLGGTTLTRFANQTLSNVLDRYVIDRTGVDGLFNIHLTFGLDDNIATGVFGGRPSAQYSAENPPPAEIEKQPNIFTALEEQLGLKLDKTRGPREYLVIDSAEKPSGF